MRRLLRRKTPSHFFLVVAAVSVITLAASSPIYSAARESHVSAVDRMVSLECSARVADELVKRLGLNDPEVTNPVFKVLCGTFTGPGSQTMVVSLYGPGSTGMIDWVVFHSLGGEWQFLMKRHQAAVLTAAGSDIREKVWIFRPGDSRCCPSGGTKARIWHWDGSRLVAGPWKQAPVRGAGFRTPSGNIECGLVDDHTRALVDCQSFRPTQRVKLYPSGRLTICRGSEARCKIGNAGEVPTLAYGRQIIVGRFRCLSRRSGLRCTVIQSGKGFLINRSGVSRVG